MLVATWNINGIKARLDVLQAWLQEAQPDVVCLQEIKSQDDTFPREPLEALGYHVETHGQKGFNGVAILSREKPDEVTRRLPGDETDEHARWLEARWTLADGRRLCVASLYLPNGNPLGTEKFTYKLSWMERLEARARQALADEDLLILAGDYNVIPEAEDAARPELWIGDALFQPESRAAYRRILNLGFTDAVRATNDSGGIYSFWDYQAGAWQKNHGIRIDHMLLSAEAADRLRSAGIQAHVRGWEKPSDHVPVLVELEAG